MKQAQVDDMINNNKQHLQQQFGKQQNIEYFAIVYKYYQTFDNYYDFILELRQVINNNPLLIANITESDSFNTILQQIGTSDLYSYFESEYKRFYNTVFKTQNIADLLQQYKFIVAELFELKQDTFYLTNENIQLLVDLQYFHSVDSLQQAFECEELKILKQLFETGTDYKQQYNKFVKDELHNLQLITGYSDPNYFYLLDILNQTDFTDLNAFMTDLKWKYSGFVDLTDYLNFIKDFSDYLIVIPQSNIDSIFKSDVIQKANSSIEFKLKNYFKRSKTDKFVALLNQQWSETFLSQMEILELIQELNEIQGETFQIIKLKDLKMKRNILLFVENNANEQ
ncbi:Hypothetical_protein [Hexamita inflata]|uniref:Hypothetical_protein n=2 Tax=Hexamita inflata TaxID=28002 RepID=A0AA86Q7Z2_9EUKA|nr:Hypothetical protein HINF_LOCUS41496 [Hexamita inflata]